MSESTFDHQKVKQDLKHAFLSSSNRVIHELAHSETSELTFDFRIFLKFLRIVL